MAAQKVRAGFYPGFIDEGAQGTEWIHSQVEDEGLVPFWGDNHLGGAVQILFEAQLKGLAHGADDALGEALAALQDVAGWGPFVTQRQPGLSS